MNQSEGEGGAQMTTVGRNRWLVAGVVGIAVLALLAAFLISRGSGDTAGADGSGGSTPSTESAAPDPSARPEFGSEVSGSAPEVAPGTIDLTPRYPREYDGQVTAGAFFQEEGGTFRYESIDIPAGTSDERALEYFMEISGREGAIAPSYSVPPVPQSANPDDPLWVSSADKRSTLLPLQQAGICCAMDGRPDAVDIANQLLAKNPPSPDDNVNVLVVDTNLIAQPDRTDVANGDIEAELKSRFVRGYYLDKGAPKTAATWDDMPMHWGKAGVDDKSTHGTMVSGYVTAQANNGKRSAGPGGFVPNVRFGICGAFSTKPGELGTKGNPSNRDITSPEAVDCLNEALKDVIRYQNDPKTGFNWDVINMSLGGLENDDAQAFAIRQLREHGVTVVISSCNYGNKYWHNYDDVHDVWVPVVSFGKNPMCFPAVVPDALSVGASAAFVGQTYSNAATPFSTRNQFVDITAPGSSLPGVLGEEKAPNDAATHNGTSYAAPLAAGSVALLQATTGDEFRCVKKGTEAERLDCTNRLRARILGTTVDVQNTATSFDWVDREPANVQGAGALNVSNMLAGYLSNGTLPGAPENMSVVPDGSRAKIDMYARYDEISLPIQVTSTGPAMTDFRVFFNGDPTKEVDASELFPSRGIPYPDLEPQMVGGRLAYPDQWPNYRVPLHPPGVGEYMVKMRSPTQGAGRGNSFVLSVQLTASSVSADGRRRLESSATTADWRVDIDQHGRFDRAFECSYDPGVLNPCK